MAHREGGPAVGACWTAHVTQMYDFTDVRRCRRLRRRRYRWGGCWDEELAARAALRVRAHWRRRRSKCSGERDSSAGRDDHRLLLPRAHLDGDRRHHRRRPLDERLHSLRRVLLPLARRRHFPGLRLPHRRGRQRDHAPDGERPHVDRRGCVLRSQGQLARVGRDGPLRRSSRGRPGEPDPLGRKGPPLRDPLGAQRAVCHRLKPIEFDRAGPPQLRVVERADRFRRVLVIERVAPRERRRDVFHAGPSTMYVGTTLPAPAVTFSSALDETRASVPLTRPQKRYGSWSMDRSRKCIRSRSTGNGCRGTATRSCTTYDAPSAARKDCSHSCWSIVQPRTTPLPPYSSFGFSTSRSLPPITKSPRSTTLPA